MEIIIPANRIEGDINSQVVVDNEITSVTISNYNVTKELSNYDDYIHSDPIAVQSDFFTYDTYFKKNIFHQEFARAELYCTSGRIQITTTKNIDKIKRIEALVTGVKKTSSFDYKKYEDDIRKANWKGNYPNTNLLQYANSFKQEEFVDKYILLLDEDFGYCYVPTHEYRAEVKNITVVDNQYVIDIEFRFPTAVKRYHFDNTAGLRPYDNKIMFIEATSLKILLGADIIDIEQDAGLEMTYGDGNNRIKYDTNELFQLRNTFNNGEEEIPIGEYVSREILGVYKNGVKTSSMTTLTDNLIVSNKKLENGHYGVRGRLERQIYKVGDNVIPYKIDKTLKELPNSEYLGLPQSFKVVENEVIYDGRLKQSLITQENTFFLISFDNKIFFVKRDNSFVGSGDRIFREEELTIRPKIPYSQNSFVVIQIEDKQTLVGKDEVDDTQYGYIKTKVLGDVKIGGRIGEMENILTKPSYTGAFTNGTLYTNISYDLTNFQKNLVHKMNVAIKFRDNNSNVYEQNYTLVDDASNNMVIIIGNAEEIRVEFIELFQNYARVRIDCSDGYMLERLTINSIEQL